MFEEISVKKIITAIQAIITIHVGDPEIDKNNDSAKNLVVPVSVSTFERHNPPPKRSNIPHPIFFSRSFHDIKPSIGAIAVISIAIILSKFFNPSKSFMGLEKIQQKTVKANKTTVPLALGVHSKSTFSTLFYAILLSGLIITHKEKITNGNNINIVGNPTANHSKKSMSRADTAIPFGGEPTIVPLPPIFAA